MYTTVSIENTLYIYIYVVVARYSTRSTVRRSAILLDLRSNAGPIVHLREKRYCYFSIKNISASVVRYRCISCTMRAHTVNTVGGANYIINILTAVSTPEHNVSSTRTIAVTCREVTRVV